MVKNCFLSKLQSLKKTNLLLTRPPILVAGLGRCGTTLIFNTIIDSGYQQGSFISRIEDFSDFQPGFVYKTHDYPPNSLPNNVKVIFLFGDPYNIVLSAHNKINEWGRLHFYHMRSNLWQDNDIIFKNDILSLKKHFQYWYKCQTFEFISIRYESLSEINTINMLNAFLGFKLKPIVFKKRNTDWTQDSRKEILITTYKNLRDCILASAPCVVWETIKYNKK